MKSVYTVKTIISNKARVLYGIIGIFILFFFPSVQVLAQCPTTTTITAPPVCQGQPIFLNVTNTPAIGGTFDVTINGELYSAITDGTPFPAKGLLDNFFGTTIPAPSFPDPTRNELGMRFKAAEDGFILGVRFYKDGAATGPFTGSLWSDLGVQLATGSFAPVAPGVSGWQTLIFSSPVAITADLIYTVSYYSPNGNYSFSNPGFTSDLTSVDGFLTAPADGGPDGPNGVYKSGGSGFPTLNFGSSNYYVDVIYQPEAVPTAFDLTDLVSTTPPCTLSGSPISSAPLVINPLPAGTISSPGIGTAGQPASINFTSSVGTAPFTLVVNGLPYTTPPDPISTAAIPSTTTTKIWNSLSLPIPTAGNDGQPIEVGMKFRTTAPGLVTALRFFRPVATTNTTILNLWDASGGNLSSVAYADGGVSSGFIEVDIPTDIQLLTNTTYVVSYYNASGDYNFTNGFMATTYTAGPISVPADGGVAGSNGVYLYGSGGGFPTLSSGLQSNYWADVVFTHATTDWTLTMTEINDANGCGVLLNQAITIQVSNPLPVTYTEFKASVENANNVKLDWATASESNNRGFDVERSADAAKWLNLGFVPGNGNSSLQNKYSFVDRSVPTGKYFYRLKQVDLDGKFKFSNILTVDINGKLAFELNQNYPNPSRGLSTITYSVPVKTNVTIKVYDMNGRVVKVLQNGERTAGRYSLTVPSDLLKSGVYYYKMEAAGFMVTRKMIVQ